MLVNSFSIDALPCVFSKLSLDWPYMDKRGKHKASLLCEFGCGSSGWFSERP